MTPTGTTPRPAPWQVWEPLDTSVPGPPLVTVMARLRATPREFVGEHVVLDALVGDTLELVEPRPLDAVLADLAFRDRPVTSVPDVPARLAAAVTCWLVTAPEVIAALAAPRADRVLAGLGHLSNLVEVLPLTSWISDDEDRQEEVARAFFRAFGLRPHGESHEMAEDRWSSISSATRREALHQAAVRQAWAEEVTRRLAEEKAREAAAQYTHV